MKKIKYTGVNRFGTLRPRRLWSPGDILEVEDDVAEELLRERGFNLVKKERKPRKKRE